MKEIIAYETDDGKKYLDKQSALEHEKEIRRMSMVSKDKFKAYNYFLKRLGEYTDNDEKTHPSKISILLFFLTSVDNFALFDIFNNFYNCLFSPVEYDISKRDKSYTDCDVNDEIKEKIDKAFDSLLKINPNIFNETPYDLSQAYKKIQIVEILDSLAKLNPNYTFERLRKEDLDHCSVNYCGKCVKW